jgi:hypothetical protein
MDGEPSSSPATPVHPRVLVCDLDETLVCTSVDPAYFDYRPPDFTFERVLFFKRPHVDDMLRHAQKLGFHVAVFTAAGSTYADAVVQGVFAPLGIVPLAVLSYQHCIERTSFDAQTGRVDRYAVKSLIQLWNHHRIDPASVVLLDDKACSALYDPANLYHVAPFTGEGGEGAWSSDTALLTFQDVLTFLHSQAHLSTVQALQLYRASSAQ